LRREKRERQRVFANTLGCRHQFVDGGLRKTHRILFVNRLGLDRRQSLCYLLDACTRAHNLLAHVHGIGDVTLNNLQLEGKLADLQGGIAQGQNLLMKLMQHVVLLLELWCNLVELREAFLQLVGFNCSWD